MGTVGSADDVERSRCSERSPAGARSIEDWPQPCDPSSRTAEACPGALHRQFPEEPSMCGIAGFADSTFGGRTDGHGSQARLEAEFNLVHRMCEVIRHRGPDDEGIHVEPGRRPGHAAAEHHRSRRRPAADPQRGPRPIWVVFNGEIYNYRELAAELEPLGHRFYTVERHRVDRPRLRAVGRGRLPPAARHVRHRAVGRAEADAAARARSRRAEAAALRRARRAARFRQRDQVAARRRRRRSARST